MRPPMTHWHTPSQLSGRAGTASGDAAAAANGVAAESPFSSNDAAARGDRISACHTGVSQALIMPSSAIVALMT